jgi:hypothetical protein
MDRRPLLRRQLQANLFHTEVQRVGTGLIGRPIDVMAQRLETGAPTGRYDSAGQATTRTGRSVPPSATGRRR